MQLQLILQFRGEARALFDRVGDPAARLEAAFGDAASFDGEDVGPHGANLFIFTNHAADALGRALTVYPGADATPGFLAAYRQVSSETFHVICPADSSAEFHLR